jgi:hypothetical protein
MSGLWTGGNQINGSCVGYEPYEWFVTGGEPDEWFVRLRGTS